MRNELVSSGLDFTKIGYRLSFYIKMSVLLTGASWRADQVVWSGKGRTPSNCLRDCTSRDRRHITSRKDSKPLALVCVLMPGMFCQDTPFIYFAAWTNCQECRGNLWYSRHVHEDFRLLCPFSIRTKIKQLTRLREKILPLFCLHIAKI